VSRARSRFLSVRLPAVALLGCLAGACGAEDEVPGGTVPAVFVEGVDQVMVGVENYITSQGVRRARLDADTAYTIEQDGRLDLRVVTMTFYGEIGDTLGVLNGQSAEYELETGNVRVRGDVEVTLRSGERFEAPVLEYLSNANEIRADSGYVYFMVDGTVDRGEYAVYDLTTEEKQYGPGRTTTPEVSVPQ
jgi:hypothetical protein